jgi:hypothetical protein
MLGVDPSRLRAPVSLRPGEAVIGSWPAAAIPLPPRNFLASEVAPGVLTLTNERLLHPRRRIELAGISDLSVEGHCLRVGVRGRNVVAFEVDEPSDVVTAIRDAVHHSAR